MDMALWKQDIDFFNLYCYGLKVWHTLSQFPFFFFPQAKMNKRTILELSIDLRVQVPRMFSDRAKVDKKTIKMGQSF